MESGEHLMQRWIQEEFSYITYKRELGIADLNEERRVRSELQIPSFHGSNVTEWILQLEKFFHFFWLNEQEKLKAAILALEDDALWWFEWEHFRRPFYEWLDLKQALRRRFGHWEVEFTLKKSAKKVAEPTIPLSQVSSEKRKGLEKRKTTTLTVLPKTPPSGSGGGGLTFEVVGIIGNNPSHEGSCEWSNDGFEFLDGPIDSGHSTGGKTCVNGGTCESGFGGTTIHGGLIKGGGFQQGGSGLTGGLVGWGYLIGKERFVKDDGRESGLKGGRESEGRACYLFSGVLNRLPQLRRRGGEFVKGGDGASGSGGGPGGVGERSGAYGGSGLLEKKGREERNEQDKVVGHRSGGGNSFNGGGLSDVGNPICGGRERWLGQSKGQMELVEKNFPDDCCLENNPKRNSKGNFVKPPQYDTSNSLDPCALHFKRLEIKEAELLHTSPAKHMHGFGLILRRPNLPTHPFYLTNQLHPISPNPFFSAPIPPGSPQTIQPNALLHSSKPMVYFTNSTPTFPILFGTQSNPFVKPNGNPSSTVPPHPKEVAARLHPTSCNFQGHLTIAVAGKELERQCKLSILLDDQYQICNGREFCANYFPP